MQITIGNILIFVIILFTINVLSMGFGLTDESWADKINILNETNISNFEEDYASGDMIIMGSEDLESDPSEGTATTDSSIITGVPFSSELTTQGTTFWGFLKGVLFGYAAVIMLLPLGSVISWLLIGIIGFFQFGAIFYLLIYIFSVIRGSGIL